MDSLPTPSDYDPAEESNYRFRANGTPCEWAESYHPSGLHPVHLGEIFNRRYEVIRKLGYGSFSTVWLVVDSRQNSFAVMKILLAKNMPNTNQELQLYKILSISNHSGALNIVGLQDAFDHLGPNGRHECLIFEPMGPHIGEFLRKSPEFEYGSILDDVWGMRFPIHLTRRVLRNVLVGLSFLHSEGIVHGDFEGIVHGDLHKGNLLVSINRPKLDGTKLHDIRQPLEEADKLERLDGKKDLWAPSYLLAPRPLQEFTSTEMDPLVKISDLGTAFIENKPPSKIITPTPLRSPEVILGLTPTRAIDIWSFGCFMFELIAERPLFSAHEGDESLVLHEMFLDEHIIQVSEVLSPLPEYMFNSWRRGHEYFDIKNHRVYRKQRSEITSQALNLAKHKKQAPLASPEPVDSLEVRIKGIKASDISKTEANELLGLLRWILQPDPSLRPSVDEILQQPWFHK